MVRSRTLLALPLTLGAVLTPATVGAQSDPARVCQSRRALTVGMWASFRVNRRGSPNGAEVRLATVATELRADTSLYWLEVMYKSRKDDPRPAIFQFLVPGLPADLTSIRGLTLKTGSWSATELADPALSVIARHIRRDYPELGALTTCMPGDVAGWETTTVPGGSFHTLHVKRADREEWLADSVPFGIVRLKSTENEIALSAYGGGARSSMEETPRQFPQWLSEMTMSLESGQALESRDAAERERLGLIVCDSLRHAQLIRTDSEPYLSPEAMLFLWAADSLPVEERPSLITDGKRPKYPKELASAGIEGRVMIQGIVGTNGRIERGTLVVISSPAPGLAFTAQQFVERAHFAPARLCGLPVRVLIQMPIDYKLKPR